MKSYILDTSVAIAWYLPEIFSDSARRWQKALLDNRIALCAPKLHFLEFSNVLRTYVKRGELEQDLALEIYELHLSLSLKILDVNLPKILETALEFQSTTYDASYISLAVDFNYPLITAEKTTTPWAVKLGTLIEFVS